MRTMRARWAGRCQGCGGAFPAGETIAWTGQAWHEACHAAMLEKEAAEQAEESAWQARMARAFKAGELVQARVVGEELVVSSCPSYELALVEARAFVASTAAATGNRAWLVRHSRGGKRYVGRELVSYYGMSTMGHREGWAFPFRVAGSAQA